jgi:hypothetical protein
MKPRTNRRDPTFHPIFLGLQGKLGCFGILVIALLFCTASSAKGEVAHGPAESHDRPMIFSFLTEESEPLAAQFDRHQVQVRASLNGAWGDSRAHQERLSWRVEQSLAQTQIGVWIPYLEPTDQASGIGDVEVFARRVLSDEISSGFKQILWMRFLAPSGDAKRSRGWESWGARVGLAPVFNVGSFEFQIQGELTRVFAGRSPEGHEADFQIAKFGTRSAYRFTPAWTIQLEGLAFDDVRVLGTRSVERVQMQSFSLLGICDVAEFAGLGLGRLAWGFQQNRRSSLSPDWALVIGIRVSPSRSLRTIDAGKSLPSR